MKRFANAQAMLNALNVNQKQAPSPSPTIIVPPKVNPVPEKPKEPWGKKLKRWGKKGLTAIMVMAVLKVIIPFLAPVGDPLEQVKGAENMMEACGKSDLPSERERLFAEAKTTYENTLEEIRGVDEKSWYSLRSWLQKMQVVVYSETEYQVAKAAAYYGLGRLYDPDRTKPRECVQNDTKKAGFYYKENVEISKPLSANDQTSARYPRAMYNIAENEMNEEKAPEKAEERLKALLEAYPKDVGAKRKLIWLYYTWIYPDPQGEAYKDYYEPLSEAKKISIQQNRREYVARIVEYLNDLGHERTPQEQCALIAIKQKEGQVRDLQEADRLCRSLEGTKPVCPVCPAN
ncbi:MAG TPA: hypothetical protein PLO56_14860 [Rhodothermales bacterium]|nr:hypothetical protein [Rhodothermales bacterium]